MNRYRKLLKNTGLITLGTFGSKLLPFILMRLYTSVLQGGDYNTADLVAQTAKLLIPFAAVGLTEGLFRLAMDGDELRRKKVFTAGFVIFGGGYVLLLPLLLAAFFLLRAWNIDFSQYMWLIGVYILTSCLHSLVTQYIRTKDHFAFFSLQGVINTLLVGLLNILFYAVGHFGVTEYVLSVVIADFLTTLIIVLKEKLWHDIVSPRGIERGIYRTMLRYAAPLIPMAVSWWVTSVSDRYMVKIFVEDGNVADWYTAAYKIPTLVTLLCTIFSQAWSYSSVAESDEKERSAFFSRVFSFYFGLLFAAGSGIVAFSKILTMIIMAPGYYDSWQFIPVLTAASVFSALVTFVGSVYTVRLKSSFSMWTSIVGAALNILLNTLLIPESLFGVRLAGMGAMGAAVATLASYFAVFLIRALTAKHYVSFDLHVPVLSANCLLFAAQCTVMTFSDRLSPFIWIPAQVLFVAAVLVVNGKSLLSQVLPMLKRGKKTN